ncbi:hypothetical protein TNCV_576011 [Trichonephila clavipes]|nr:hypothetical protein TNCV_576011 [Trichonephila clavipes]
MSNHGPHVFYRRKIQRTSRSDKQFNLVIDEEPLNNAGHLWSCIILLKYGSEGKEGQLAPPAWRCSVGCLKYRQCVLEECESDIKYRTIP